MKFRVLLALAALSSALYMHAAAYDPTPRIGILIPKNPPDYTLFLDALQNPAHVHDGPFDFLAGTLAGTPVVLIVQPAPGEVLRALGAITMIHDFNLRLLLYPGTSGGHLPKGEMGPGDIVLGAKNVDHGNYYLAPDGHIEAGEFTPIVPGQPYVGPLYANPSLLAMLACSTTHIAGDTRLPPWVDPIRPDAHPQIFYFGIQGTSTIWSDNAAYTRATMKIFHEIDEDGDWYSNLAASLYGIPFIEVSVISNSIFAFPGRSHGTPANPATEPNSHILAQRLSNRILLDLIARHGIELLTGLYPNPSGNPYPLEHFERPRDPGRLLDSCQP
jgi:adenosylhomocysteine nucleosidase